jgi:non-ribosomal peptide synthetase component F
MIYVHSLGRALRFYPGRTVLARDSRLLTFRELHTRVEGIAATLTSHGFGVGDRLALLTTLDGFECIHSTYIRSIHHTRNIATMAPAM